MGSVICIMQLASYVTFTNLFILSESARNQVNASPIQIAWKVMVNVNFIKINRPLGLVQPTRSLRHSPEAVP